MKKIALILVLWMLWAGPGWGDELDDALGDAASQQIRNHTRQMVQAGISQEDAVELTRAMIRSRFRETYVVRAQQLLVETQNSGLPVEPVMNKLYEGMAKGIPDQTVFQAMEKTQVRYSFAYQKARTITSNPKNRNSLGNTVAECMQAGLQNPDVDQIMERLQVRTRQMTQNSADELALHTFLSTRTMARLGVDRTTVTDVISQAIQHQFTAQEMQQIGNNFKNQSRYASPNQLAAQYAQGIGAGDKPGNLGAGHEDGPAQSGETTQQQGTSSGSPGGKGASGGSNSGSDRDSGKSSGKRGK